MMKMQQAGFTLIELLIALSLMAIIAVIATVGLHRFLHMKSVLVARQTTWTRINIALTAMQADLDQAMPRAVRDRSGGVLPPFSLNQNGFSVTRYTHAPSEATVSAMQRVNYVWSGQKLLRITSAHLDTTENTPQQRDVLLSHVQQFQVQVIDQHGQLQSAWHPRSDATVIGEATPYFLPMPRGVVVSMVTPMGQFYRVFAMPGSLRWAKEGTL